MENKVITIKTWQRPYYYKQVLDYLAKCDGIEEYKIIHCMDGTVQAHQMMEAGHPLADQIEGHEPIPKHFGCAGNTRRCFNLGFDYLEKINGSASPSDFVLHLEDDLLPGKDWLTYMEWASDAAGAFWSDANICLITGWNRRLASLSGAHRASEMHLVARRSTPVNEHLTYQGWGLWRDRWEGIKNNFFGIHWNFKEPQAIPYGEEFLKLCRLADDGSWGWPMKMYHMRGRQEIYPLISRVQNIGAHNGRFNQNPEWHAANVYNHVWSEDIPAPDHYEETKDERAMV